MKKNVTYIAQELFEGVAKELGLGWKEQAGFIKVAGATGRAVYVARTKRVGRVDISGFTSSSPGVRDLGGESFGAVTQQLDFSRTEPEILATFRLVLGELKALPAREKEPRKQLEPKAAKPEAPEASPDERKAQRAARLATIRAAAAQKGVPVSPETEARLSADAE